ncbi:MAG: M42 family peptidase [Oscillospiraceae bacterium]|jgi:endoglucanase|nr:M42 family peptidase [Oscillospiraceae bacterium]
MLTHLKNLCALSGVSGHEDTVREAIRAVLAQANIPVQTDNLGNLLVRRAKAGTPKIALFAHMDEVGFLVRYITAEGFLRVAPVGGVEASVAMGTRVAVGKGFIPGVFGAKPVHLLSADEKGKLPSIDSLYVDIGAQSRRDAEKYTQLGNAVTFERRYTVTNGGILSPALDDRAGCAVLLDLLLNTDLPIDAAFTVQEEVGTRGAQTAAYALEPDIALVLEATTAADLPGAADGKKVCEMGKGAAISFMDNRTIYEKKLFGLALHVAREKGISAQVKSMVAGGNDAAVIHKSRAGVRTLAISVPCRYLHSPCGVMAQSDLFAVRDLAAVLVEELLSS